MSITPSPVVALNRAIAIAQVEGPERGLAEIAAIANRERLATYPFYQAAIGELEFRRRRYVEARDHFRAAVAVARNPARRGFLERGERACGEFARRYSVPLSILACDPAVHRFTPQMATPRRKAAPNAAAPRS